MVVVLNLTEMIKLLGDARIDDEKQEQSIWSNGKDRIGGKFKVKR